LSGGEGLIRSAPGPVATQHATQQHSHVQQHDGCPACHAALVPGAAFCTECGHSLGCPCPQCGVEVGGFEFCEACGYWLKPGQCRFCYAETIEGATFCTECGNDQNGIRCVRCHSVGFFDFCSQCGDPVSELARSLDQGPDDPLLADALGALRALDEADRQAADRAAQLQAQVQAHARATRASPAPARPAPPTPRPELNLAGALRSMRSFAAQDAAAAEKARQQAVLDRQAERARAAAAQAAADEAAQAEAAQAERQQQMAGSEAGVLAFTIEREARLAERKRQLEALMQLLQALHTRTYENGQQARSDQMQVRRAMAKLGVKEQGWRCNAYHNTHSSPNDCAAPQHGGAWLFVPAE
jgi:hypothetical protein